MEDSQARLHRQRDRVTGRVAAPLSAYAQAVKAANEAVDQRKKALEIIGATEGQLAQVEAMRAEVVRQATGEMLRSFDQSIAQRWAAVNGNSDEVGRAIASQRVAGDDPNSSGRLRAGGGTVEAPRGGDGEGRAGRLPKSEYDSLRAQMDALEQQRSASATGDTGADQRHQYWLSAAKTLQEAWKARQEPWPIPLQPFAGSANLDAENRLGIGTGRVPAAVGACAGRRFRRAAGQLAGVGTSCSTS